MEIKLDSSTYSLKYKEHSWPQKESTGSTVCFSLIMSVQHSLHCYGWLICFSCLLYYRDLKGALHNLALCPWTFGVNTKHSNSAQIHFQLQKGNLSLSWFLKPTCFLFRCQPLKITSPPTQCFCNCQKLTLKLKVHLCYSNEAKVS